MKKYFFLLTSVLFLSFSQFSFATEEITMCTMEAKLCSDGVTYVGRSWANCEFEACPVVEQPKICTKEYMPVCGQPKMPECSPWMACPMVMPLPKTYSNKCSMESEWATLVSVGECPHSNTSLPLLTKMMIQKIDTKILSITQKIDKKYTDTTKKSLLVYKLIGKLNAMNPKSERLQEAISYIIQKLESYSRSIQDQSSWGLPD